MSRIGIARRSWILGSAGFVLLLGAGAAFAALALGEDQRASASDRAFSGATAPVTRGDLSGTTTVAGSLRYQDPRPIRAGSEGVVTRLPAADSVIGSGGLLFQVDDRPTTLFHGAQPAWRAFEPGMSDGPDVTLLEQGLAKLGFFDGEPGEHFTWETRDAIERWQDSTGRPVTGIVQLGEVVFAPGDVRAGEITARAGDRVDVTSELFQATGTTQEAEVSVKLQDQGLVKKGAKVSVRLPGGADTPGTVASVGAVQNKTSGDREERVIPVGVVLDDPEAARDVQEAGVTVSFTTEVRKDVLSVPVGALVALDAKRFGVEEVRADGTTRKIPVTTGLFAGGRVEVSGEWLTEGLEVAVPER